jgi:hypothetical protein
MPAPAATQPSVTVQSVSAHPDLRGNVRDHGGLMIRKAAVLAPERQLHCKAELTDVNQPGQQRQILWQQRPALAQLVRRPNALQPVTLPSD